MMTEEEINAILPNITDEKERELFQRYARDGNFKLVDYINNIGIELIESEKLNKISGFVAFRDGKWIICVNSTDCPKRKRFTIAHELGHYYLHRSHLQNDGHVDYLYRNVNAALTQEERQRENDANDFAAQILMPENEFRNLWNRTNLQISDLSEIFNVSESAILVRAKKLGLSDVVDCY